MKGRKARIPKPKAPTVPLTTTEFPPPKVALFQRSIPAKVWVETGEWAFVISSWVERIRFERASQQLYIDFLDGFSYSYFGVGEQVAKDMHNCNSMGRYILQRLKGRYQGRAVPRNPFIFIHGRQYLSPAGATPGDKN